MSIEEYEYSETAAAREQARAAERRLVQRERLAQQERESEPIADVAQLRAAVAGLASRWGLKKKKARRS